MIKSIDQLNQNLKSGFLLKHWIYIVMTFLFNHKVVIHSSSINIPIDQITTRTIEKSLERAFLALVIRLYAY